MTRPNMLRFCSALCVAAMLAGCGNLVELGPSGPPPLIYTLEPPARDDSHVGAASRPQIAVMEPELSGGLDTDGVAVRNAAHSLSYLAGGRWESRTPELIQRYIARALDNSGVLRAYREGQFDIAPGYRLHLDVYAFEARVSADSGALPQVHIVWQAVLTDPQTGRLLEDRIFRIEEMVARDSSSAIIGAFDQGMTRLVTELTGWIKDAIGDAGS